jgi:hypothetical protein
MWLKGQCGFTFSLCWRAGQVAVIGDDDSVLVAVVGDIGMVGGRAVWAARVVTFDMSGQGR